MDNPSSELPEFQDCTNLLSYLYSISKIISEFTDQKSALDEISHLLQAILPYNYLLIYQFDANNQSQILLARSFDLSEPEDELFNWEEVLAEGVLQSPITILQQPAPGSTNFPEFAPHFLGVPFLFEEKGKGALAFVRYNKVAFSKIEVKLAELIAQQIGIIIQKTSWLKEHNLLETQRQQVTLQENFISNITHDLRNPLGCIKGYTTTLLRTDITWEPKTQHEFLEIVDEETDRLREMIDNLLDSSRAQAGRLDMEFQLMRLDGLVKDIIEQNQHRYPDLKLELIYEDPLPPIVGDSRRLTRVFDNLISNVVKHAPKSPVSITIKQEDKGLLIEVQDYGQGISEKYLSHIFERFFRVPENAPNVHGSGVGLFICKQIILAHQGRIWVSSTPGHGTVIHFVLPYKP